MANLRETTLVALATTMEPGGGATAPPPRWGPPGRFTDEELAAAQKLVLLSESSSEDVALRAAASGSSSSSLPSVGNAGLRVPEASVAGEEKDDDEGEEDGMLTGPRVRRPRFRAIYSLYAATSPIGGVGEETAAAQRRKKSMR